MTVLAKIKLPTGPTLTVENTQENLDALAELCGKYTTLFTMSTELVANVDNMLGSLPLIKKLSDADLSAIAQLQPVSDMLGRPEAEETTS